MPLNVMNPFANYGTIVSGDRFIGRKDDLRIIENRVVRPLEPGNLAIIGNYRVGKSSLVHEAIIEVKSQLLSRHLLPIWINVATCNEASAFLKALVHYCYNEMEDLGWTTQTVKDIADSILQSKFTSPDIYLHIQRFFQKIRQGGFRIVFIFDEFDHARRLFKGDISGFQKLRDLSYQPGWRVAFITISRRTLRDIEIQSGAISSLDLTFQKHFLGLFNEVDLQEYLNRLSLIGISITPTLKERIEFYCGAHPYLLAMLGYEIVEMFREEGQVDVDRAAQRVERSFLDYYDHVIGLLTEDGSLNKMLQILFGPVVDVKEPDVDELLRYGLIKPTNQGSYFAFSMHFQTYLRIMERQVDLWPIWKQTELALRDIVAMKMIEKYGERWVDKVEKVRPNLRPLFDACRELQQKEETAFGGRASHNLLDFTYPYDLFRIIFAEWDVFKPIFKQDKNYWEHRAQLLAKIRNPLCHNRDKILYDYEKEQVEAYCKEILTILQRR